jgi:hypothetical protein
MKSELKTLPVEITNIQGEKTTGTVELRIWDKKERTMRALKALGMTWGAAAVCVIFPIIHFVLVPVLILAGPIIFSIVVGQEQVILGGKGQCPKCKQEFEIARSSVKWPMTDICNHCQAELKIGQLPETVSATEAAQI